jgi:hypothetical protein
MASAVHIPLEALPADTRELLERAKETGEIFIDGEGIRFKISLLPGRTAQEALDLMRDSPFADIEVDDEWSKDMQGIYEENRRNDRDPWAE